MGNQDSTLTAKERSFYSVEYLGANQDLDFTKLENFTNKTYLESSLLPNHLSRAFNDHLRSIDTKETTNTSDQESHSSCQSMSSNYETLDYRQGSNNLLNASCQSTQNLVGLVRNGGVLVQRSKSYVKPENRVLPTEFPTKPLKQTNLLKTEGMKRTWRNNAKRSFLKSGVFEGKLDDDTEVVISPSLIKSMLNSRSSHSLSAKGSAISDPRENLNEILNIKPIPTSKSIQDLTITTCPNICIVPDREVDLKKLRHKDKLKIDESSRDKKLSKDTSAVKAARKYSKLSSWSMLNKNRQEFNLTEITKSVQASSPSQTSGPTGDVTCEKPIDTGKKVGKSRSFLHRLTSTYKPANNEDKLLSHLKASSDIGKSKTVSKLNKGDLNCSNTDKNIQIISRFPINSKAYRHYISGNGNTCDKLTNSIEISHLIKANRKSFSKKHGSIRKRKSLNKTNKTDTQQSENRFNTFVVRKNELFVAQERAIDVDPVYDSIDDCNSSKVVLVNKKVDGENFRLPCVETVTEEEDSKRFYFENLSTSSEDSVTKPKPKPRHMKCSSLLIPSLNETESTRPASILIAEDVKKANDLINSCKKIINENTHIDYEYLANASSSAPATSARNDQTKHKLNESSSSSLETSVLKKKSDRGQTKFSAELDRIKNVEMSKRAYDERKTRSKGFEQQTNQNSDSSNFIEFYLKSASEEETRNGTEPISKSSMEKIQRESVVSIINKKTKRNSESVFFNNPSTNIFEPTVTTQPIPDSNFILKPKKHDEAPPISDKTELTHVYQSINNEQQIRQPQKPDQGSKLTANKNRRKGLDEIFPNINLEQEVGMRLKIKDPDWCPASDLNDSDLEETLELVNSPYNIDNNKSMLAKKISGQIEQRKKMSLNGNRRSRSSSSYASSSYERRDEDFGCESQHFGHLNILY